MKYFSASFFLHIFLSSLLFLSIPPSAVLQEEDALSVDMIEDPPAEEPKTENPEKQAPKSDVTEPGEGPPCEKYYGGIGIYGAGYIEVVYPGYPADLAGIKTGDYIYSKEEIRGEPGTSVTIIILREQKQLTFTIIRARICLGGD